VIVYLPKKFAAAAAWRQDNAILVYGDDHLHGRLPSFQHFRNSGVLGTEAKTTLSVHTYACKNM
jgi:hypothetical protein